MSKYWQYISIVRVPLNSIIIADGYSNELENSDEFNTSKQSNMYIYGFFRARSEFHSSEYSSAITTSVVSTHISELRLIGQGEKGRRRRRLSIDLGRAASDPRQRTRNRKRAEAGCRSASVTQSCPPSSLCSWPAFIFYPPPAATVAWPATQFSVV